MALEAGKVQLSVEPNLDKFNSSVQSKMNGLSKGLTSTGKKMSLALSAPIALFAKKAIGEAEEAQRVSRQTEAVLKSTGSAANVTAGHITDLAQSISDYAGIDDEAIQSAENLLLTFTGVRNEAGKGNDIFDQTTKVMVDLSAAMGTDAKTAALQLGKALNDPMKGYARLQRIGVLFTDQQVEQIKVLSDSGDKLGAQKVILAELTKEFGGSAAANATASEKLKVAFDNLAESVGTLLLPSVEKIATFMQRATKSFDGLTPRIQRLIVNFGGVVAVIGPVLFVTGKLITAYKGLKLGTIALSAKTTQLASKLPTVGEAGLSSVAGLAAMAYAAQQGYLQLRQYIDGDFTGAVARGITAMGKAMGFTVPSFDHASLSAEEFKNTAESLMKQLVKGKIDTDTFRRSLRAAAKAAGVSDDQIDRLTDSLVKEAGKQRAAATATHKAATAHHKAAAAAGEQKEAENRLAGGLIAFIQAQRDHADALKNLTDLRKKGKRGTDEYKDAELEVVSTEEDLRTTRKEYTDTLKKSGSTQEEATRKFRIFGHQAGLTAAEVRDLNTELATLNGLTGNINMPPPKVPPHHIAAGGQAAGGIVTRPTVALVGEAGPEAILPLSGNRGQMHVIVDNPHDFGDDGENVRHDRRMSRSSR